VVDPFGRGRKQGTGHQKVDVSVPAGGEEYSAMDLAQTQAVAKLSEEISSAIKAEIQNSEKVKI